MKTSSRRFRDREDGRKPYFVHVEIDLDYMPVLARSAEEAEKIARAQFRLAESDYRASFFASTPATVAPSDLGDHELFYMDGEQEDIAVKDLFMTAEEIEAEERAKMLEKAQVRLFQEGGDS